MYVVIVGGGKVGFSLAKALLEGRHEVLVLEKAERRYQIIAEELGEMAVWGDGTEVRVLERAGVRRADVLVAVTGDDEDNLVSCQLAKGRFGVRRTIARINNPKNEEIFKLLGIDETVSATHVLEALIEEELRDKQLLPLLALRQGDLEIVQINISPQAPSVGRPIRDLRLPPDCLLAVLLRGHKASVIQGDTVIQADDAILALVPLGKAEALRAALLS